MTTSRTTTRKKAAPRKTSGPKWPADHSAKHAQAARKGWAHRRGPGSTVARFGGSSAHTVKTHYLKPRKKAAPKAKPAAVKASPDTYELVAVQKANGKWVVMRKYKSGKVVAHSEKEYASNPFGKRAVKAKPVRGQSALFGGAYEQEKTYGKGLFG